MRVRDAVEADADAMAAIANAPADVMRNIVHDRTVRVAELETDTEDVDANDADSDDAGSDDAGSDGAGSDGAGSDDAGSDGAGSDDAVGFVSFDVRGDVVHVTQIDGTPDACELLLAEPIRFAENEGMRVELLVTDEGGDVATAAERVGFESEGAGPRFDGEKTVRYRFSPA